MSAFTTQNRRAFLATLGGVTALHATVGESLGSTFAAPASRAESNPPDAREYLFTKGLKYFNTAAMGPAPRRVLEEAMRVWYDLEANPSFHGYFHLKDAMEGVRATAGRVMRSSAAEMMVTNSTTDGMNTVAQGLGLKAGQRILTTDQEHPGGQLCWQHYARKAGAIIDTVAIPPGENDTGAIVDRFAQAMRPETRVISVSHVLWATGLRMPIREIAQLSQHRGCFCVVDGAQAVGAIAVDVKRLGCDAYVTSGHKWIMGPKGTGLLYLRDDPSKSIDPLVFEDGRGVYVESTGVRNIPGILGLGIALDLLASRGPDAVETRALALRNRLYTGLRGIQRITIPSPEPGPLASPIVTIALPAAVDNAGFATMLREKYQVIVKPLPKHALNAIRASAHIFNTEEEVDYLLRALRTELT